MCISNAEWRYIIVRYGQEIVEAAGVDIHNDDDELEVVLDRGWQNMSDVRRNEIMNEAEETVFPEIHADRLEWEASGQLSLPLPGLDPDEDFDDDEDDEDDEEDETEEYALPERAMARYAVTI